MPKNLFGNEMEFNFFPLQVVESAVETFPKIYEGVMDFVDGKGYTKDENLQAIFDFIDSLNVIAPYISQGIQFFRDNTEYFYTERELFEALIRFDLEYNDGEISEYLEFNLGLDIKKAQGKNKNLKIGSSVSKDDLDLMVSNYENLLKQKDLDIEFKDDEIRRLEKQLDGLKSSKTKDDDIDNLNLQIDELKDEIKDLELDVKYNLSKDKDIKSFKTQLNDLKKDKLELESNLDDCLKHKDIGFDPDDPFNPCLPYMGGKKMRLSKAGERPIDILDGMGMQSRCCEDSKKNNAELIKAIKEIPKSIKANHFIGKKQNITVSDVVVNRETQTINVPELTVEKQSETINIPDITVNRTAETVSIPNIKQDTKVTKIPNLEQANLDLKDIKDVIKTELVNAVKNILFSNSSTDKKAKENLKTMFKQLTTKTSHNPKTLSDGTLSGNYTPLELQAMKDKAQLQTSNDENNFDVDIDGIIDTLVSLVGNEPEHLDMTKDIDTLSKKSK